MKKETNTAVTVTEQVTATAGNIVATVKSIDKNSIIRKVATENIKIEKENTLTYIKELLSTPTAEIEKNNPLFAGTNILYLYLNSQLVHLELEDKGTEKVVNLILWVVAKSGINPFRFISNYKDLEILKKYYPNFAITENTDKTGLQNQLTEIIKFEAFISNYMNDKSEYPTPAYMRKSDDLKPLFIDLKSNGHKLKDFDYIAITSYNAIISQLKKDNN